MRMLSSSDCFGLARDVRGLNDLVQKKTFDSFVTLQDCGCVDID